MNKEPFLGCGGQSAFLAETKLIRPCVVEERGWSNGGNTNSTFMAAVKPVVRVEMGYAGVTLTYVYSHSKASC